MSIRTAFFGTPEFALDSLLELSKLAEIDLQAVITQPDKPSGRGMKLRPSPVKEFALANEIEVFQPNSLKKEAETEELWNFLRSTGPYDVFVCVAYGKVIPADLLYFPALGTINIHPSLLPRWRGAAPMQRAIFEGDLKSGVSIMQLEEGLDSGPVFATKEIELAEDETLGTLHDKLAQLGSELLLETLPKINRGELTAREQSSQGITYAEKWNKEDLEINWTESAQVSERRIRASSPIPGARCSFREETFKVFEAHATKDCNYQEAEPGTIVEANKQELVVSCGDSSFLSLGVIQIPGKSKMRVEEFLKGKEIQKGEKLS
jgi:methionyl-tRNA formyltransferase